MNRQIIYSFLLYFFWGVVCASPPSHVNSPSKDPSQNTPTLQSFAAFTTGADFIRTGQPQTLTLLPPFSNYYTANDSL